MPRATIYEGEAREVLRELRAQSVHMCVTSPPYWGQRDYEVDGQIGLEDTVWEWLENLVEVFDEVKRVLHDDGLMFINIGDGYNSAQSRGTYGDQSKKGYSAHGMKRATVANMHPKNLLGTPWMLAQALQEKGWIWRSNIPWIKENPMPHNADDRPTNSHEAILMFSKSERYFFDELVMRKRYRLDHWKINTEKGYVSPHRSHDDDDHYATYPVEVPRRAILLGSSERGSCPTCRIPMSRNTIREEVESNDKGNRKRANAKGAQLSKTSALRTGKTVQYIDGGFFCRLCNYADDMVNMSIAKCPNSVILDPFSGTGTSGIAAMRHGRDYVGIELKSIYAEDSYHRIYDEAPLFNEVVVVRDELATSKK